MKTKHIVSMLTIASATVATTNAQTHCLSASAADYPTVQSNDSCWVNFVEDPNVFQSLAGNDVNNPNEKDIAVADFDNDGDLDVISVEKQNGYAPAAKPHTLWINENGVLVDRSSTLSGNSQSSRDVAILDADGDGFLDFVVANTTTGNSVNSGPRRVGLWINQTQPMGQFAGFTKATGWLSTDCNAPANCASTNCDQQLLSCAIATGDLNNDGLDDIWVTTYGPAAISARSETGDRVYINDENNPGTFLDRTYEALGCVQFAVNEGGSTTAAIRDFDGDGALDLLTGGPSMNWRVFFNDDNGLDIPTFTQQTGMIDVSMPDGPYMAGVEDMNADGFPDLYIAGDFCESISFSPGGLDARTGSNWVNTKLTDPDKHIKTIGGGGNLFFADVDGDGFMDVGVGDVDTSAGPTWTDLTRTPFMLRNRTTSAGNFGGLEDPDNDILAPVNITTDSVWDGAFMDLDGDGLLDLLYATTQGFKFFRRLPDATHYGTSTPNSVGPGAFIDFSGRPSISENQFELNATGGPANTLGQFFFALQPTSTPIPVFDGTLWVTGSLERLAPITADATGAFVDLLNFPDPEFSMVLPCDTIYFQLMYRDAGFGSFGTNFSDALAVTLWE